MKMPDTIGSVAADYDPAVVACNDSLPHYAPLLAARHAAHQHELRQIIGDLPLASARLVLDVPCGDGFFSGCLADVVEANGTVVAGDASLQYLQAARQATGEDAEPPGILFVRLDSYGLPFPNDRFDLAWCAQSLLTLKQPVAALQELRRIVRQGGSVVILEEDRVHEMRLPWPAGLADAIRKAEQRALEAVLQRHAADRNPALQTEHLLQQAGLTPVRRTTYEIRRAFPLPEPDQVFLRHYFPALRERVSPYLTRSQVRELRTLTDPVSPDYLPHQRNFRMAWQEIVAIGAKR